MEVLARNNERLFRDIHEQEQYLAATDAQLTEALFELQKNAEETRVEREELTQASRGRQSALRRVRAQREERAAWDYRASWRSCRWRPRDATGRPPKPTRPRGGRQRATSTGTRRGGPAGQARRARGMARQ